MVLAPPYGLGAATWKVPKYFDCPKYRLLGTGHFPGLGTWEMEIGFELAVNTECYAPLKRLEKIKHWTIASSKDAGSSRLTGDGIATNTTFIHRGKEKENKKKNKGTTLG